ncbi:anaerobic ribonucleoside-triphosphate reductase activating protein [Pseudomonas pohangensis]|uniref:Anaerobic ribonucleoside-triphosphate reductase activating protein n=1 Tax=Pseudomonas pohangensis TaxID=364197 RepID=A0A1H2I6M5_9PSED|nr:anaerobic ribonucleoside-triphosphate reductase activating protein [Pseudomonas pohangensis]SDU39596.1 anaerobic ribonucleoside-triphosphate reductase activating protein [Pseudomonas pohangensis]
MIPALRVGGLLPLTTLDYPGQLACVLFCQGCAWRCRYCHNPELIGPRGRQETPWAEVLAFLRKRQGLLDAVVFSGGEATLQAGLPAAMRQVRELGFKIGLHSAGIKPAAFKRVLSLCDWVGFDVKALEEDTALITGVSHSGRTNWQSLELLLDSGVEYECRTTVHWQLSDCRRLQRLGERLASIGVEHFVVQQARNQQVLDEQLPPSVCPPDSEQLWSYLQQLFAHFSLRAA